MARRRSERQPLDAIDLLRIRMALRRGSAVVSVGIPARLVVLADLLVERHAELTALAESDHRNAPSARALLALVDAP
jgi:hypothetical protein